MYVLKKVMLIFFMLFLCHLSFSPVYAQDYSPIMYELYVESVLYPENFDRVIARNRALFDGNFRDCLSNLTGAYMQVGRREMEVCDSHANPRWRSQCYQESMGAGMWMWCLSLRAALDGTPWQQTTAGSNTVFAKQIFRIFVLL